MGEVLRSGGALWLAAVLSGACACSTDTAGLARREPGHGAAAGAFGGTLAGGGGGSAGSAGDLGGSGGDSSSALDPTGGAIEIVHGIVDGGRLFACLREAASGSPLGDDMPQPNDGIAYGRGFGLPANWDAATGDVEIELFVALPAALAGAGCAALRASAGDSDALPARTPDAGTLDAGSAPEPAFPLEPEVPRRAGAVRLAPGVLRAGARYALVAAGCTHAEGSSDDVCGPLDALFGTRLGLVLAEIASELPSGQTAFGLQFLNASRALPRADLVLQWESLRTALRVATDVGFASVRPRDAAAVDDDPVGLELHVRGESIASFTQAWSDVVASSSASALVAGGNYLAVYVGPLPSAVTGAVGPPRFVLVPGPGPASDAALSQ